MGEGLCQGLDLRHARGCMSLSHTPCCHLRGGHRELEKLGCSPGCSHHAPVPLLGVARACRTTGVRGVLHRCVRVSLRCQAGGVPVHRPRRVFLGTETPLISVALELVFNEHVGFVFIHIFIHPSSQQTLAEHLLHARPCAGARDTDNSCSPRAASLIEDPNMCRNHFQ